MVNQNSVLGSELPPVPFGFTEAVLVAATYAVIVLVGVVSESAAIFPSLHHHFPFVAVLLMYTSAAASPAAVEPILD